MLDSMPDEKLARVPDGSRETARVYRMAGRGFNATRVPWEEREK